MRTEISSSAFSILDCEFKIGGEKNLDEKTVAVFTDDLSHDSINLEYKEGIEEMALCVLIISQIYVRELKSSMDIFSLIDVYSMVLFSELEFSIEGVAVNKVAFILVSFVLGLDVVCLLISKSS